MKLEIEVTDNKDYKEIVEGMSFKKIIKSVQNKVDKGTKVLYVKYKNKKGTEINRAVDIPIGRKKKLMDNEVVIFNIAFILFISIMLTIIL